MNENNCKTCKYYKKTEYNGDFCESPDNIFYYLEEKTYRKRKDYRQRIYDIDKRTCNYKPNLLEKLNILIYNVRFRFHKKFNPELIIKD